MKKIVFDAFLIVAALLWAILFQTGCLSSPASTSASGEESKPVDYTIYEKNAPLELVLQDGHSNGIGTVKYSPDGSLIVSGAGDKTLKLWTPEGRLLRTFSPNASGIAAVDFSPDGRYLACNSDTDINIWEVDGTLQRTISGNEHKVLQIAFSPVDELIAIGTGFGTVEIRDLSGNLVESYKKHDGMVQSLQFSPDGSRLASGGWDKSRREQVIKYYTLKGRDIDRFDADECGDAFCFSHDGNYLISAENSHKGAAPLATVEIREIGREYRRDITINGTVSAIAISRDDGMIAIGTHQGFIEFLDRNGNRLDSYIQSRWTVKSLDFSPDGKSLVYAAGGDVPMEDHSISIVDLVDKKSHDIRGFMDPLQDVSVSRSGNFIAQGSGNNIKVWDIPNSAVRTFTGYGRAVRFIAFDDSDSYLLGSDGNKIIVRDFRGKLVSEFGKSGAGYMDAAFITGTEKILCATYDSGIEIRSIEGELLEMFNSPEAGGTMSLSLSPEGEYFITANADEKIRLWDIAGNLLRSYQGHEDDILSLDFSPDGKHFVSGSRDGTVRLWDIETGPVHSFDGFKDLVNSVAFSPDGIFIAAGGGRDNTIQVWRSDSFSQVYGDTRRNGIVGIAFIPGGTHIVCAEGDYSLSLRDFMNEEAGTLSLAAFNNGEWFGRLSTGLFDCSSRGYEYLHFVKGLKILSPEQFWEGFYFPNLIAVYLTGGDLPRRDIGTITDTIPTVEMYIHRPYGEEDPRLEITVSNEREQVALGRFFLLHNGRIVNEKTRGVELLGSNRSRKFSIRLMEGKNLLQAGIYNEKNNAYGTGDIHTVLYTPTRFETPDMYILSVGVSTYLDSNINLGSPSGDAKDFSAVLETLGDKLYDKVEVSTLLDQQAVKKNILENLEILSRETEETDTVILFFAGHGEVHEGKYYFLPSDADILNLETSAVSIDLLNTLIGRIPAKKMAVFLDTCRSGSAVKSIGLMAMTRSIEEKREIASLAKAQGIAVFSASAADQYAYEIPQLGNGIFTHSLLQALGTRQAEISIEGKISLSKLLAIVNRITRDTAYTYLGVEQSPSMYLFGDDFFLGEY